MVLPAGRQGRLARWGLSRTSDYPTAFSWGSVWVGDEFMGFLSNTLRNVWRASFNTSYYGIDGTTVPREIAAQDMKFFLNNCTAYPG